MSELNRRLLRAACRLQSAYAALPSDRSRIDLPHCAWEEMQAAFRTWSTACDRKWQATAAQLRETLVRELEQLSSQLRDRLSMIRTEAPQAVPPLRLLYEELVAADGEFDGVQLEEGELSVTTEPIVLDDIALGRFQIRLHLARLGTDPPYSIKALDPNPAASCGETTHPHVSSQRLCPGEGRSAIAGALAEGRLFDFFTIVDRILRTYSVGSAYVELDQWSGVRCHDCDSTVDEEDACTCTHCDEQICGDCLIHCGGCGDGYCSGCIDRCFRCEEYSCGRCLKVCTSCHRTMCGSCCEEAVCETCLETMEEEDDPESEEFSAKSDAAPSEPAI